MNKKRYGCMGGIVMEIDIKRIRQKFNEDYTDAVLEMISANSIGQRAIAVSLFHAFKRGYINGQKDTADNDDVYMQVRRRAA
jgi:hypothetical protein